MSLQFRTVASITVVAEEYEAEYSTLFVNSSFNGDYCRVKALVSMMTPRDHRVAQNPSFVEFDMSLEGFACLLVPSLSPVSADLGGVGHGERVFPPLNGLTVAT